MEPNYIDINKKLWNKRVPIHYQSAFYDMPSFLKGADSLNSIELELLGNIPGKKILHIQCHFGQDTISLAKHGAEVTGIDLSDKAIEQALELNKKLGTDARFIQSDVYKLHEVLNESFDVVFTSYGVIGWLPDMEKWAKTVHHFLKPGGKLVLVEFHPIVWMFSDDFSKIEYNYLKSGPIVEELEGTYTNNDANIRDQSITWNHGLSTVINSLIKQGLTISDFREYNYSPYNCFKQTIEIETRKFQIKGLEEKIPMVYSVKAIK